MAKRKSPPQKSAPSPTVAMPAVGGRFSSKAIRETVESLAVAFILAFLFRTFQAEAFVIPTGSMAPTLMGQHKDLLCPECGYRYQAGASSEVEDVAQQRGRQATQPIASCNCPLCRFTADVDPTTTKGRDFPTYPGDRILVSKFAYEFAEPDRWDVIVFKYPAEAQINYIKRLIGLPEETVRIWHGDIYIKSKGASEYQIERRSPAKLRAMAQIVYDNDYVVDTMTQKGWPVRWQPWPAGQAASSGSWSSSDGSRSYEIDGSDGEQWLRYQHFVPTIRNWELLEQTSLSAADQPKPQLITDFYSYNTSVPRNYSISQPALEGLHWVGDLLLECQLDVKAASGTTTLELVKGGKHFRCELDCATGKARLSIEGLPDFHPEAQTAMRGPGSHRVVFANVDEQLLLWVDGSVVPFDSTTIYPPLDNERPRADERDPGDLAPAGIASQGAQLRVSHMRLWRDLYYIAADGGNTLTDYREGSTLRMNYYELVEFFSSPKRWSPPGEQSPFDDRREVSFPLAADQFFVLGDNSPASADARLWVDEKYVSRELLIGKALLVFWPHSFHRVPGTPIPFPFFPNFARMGLIR